MLYRQIFIIIFTFILTINPLFSAPKEHELPKNAIKNKAEAHSKKQLYIKVMNEDKASQKNANIKSKNYPNNKSNINSYKTSKNSNKSKKNIEVDKKDINLKLPKISGENTIENKKENKVEKAETSLKNPNITDNENNQNSENKINSEEKPQKIIKKSYESLTEKLWKKFTVSDIENLQKIYAYTKQNNHDLAIDAVNEIKKNNQNDNDLINAVNDIILWNKYSGKIDPKRISFKDISAFVIDSPYLPNINDLRRNVEKVALVNDIDYNQSRIYFNLNPPLTTESKVYVVESKIIKIASDKNNLENRDEKTKIIQSEIAKIWIKENFSIDDEKKYLDKYQEILTQKDHAERIERLLWEGKKIDAYRIFNLVDRDYQKLFETIIKLDEIPRYIDNLIIDIPRKFRTNELLNFKRMIWYKNKDEIDDLIDLLVDISDTKMPEKWWSFRRLYAREMIKERKFKKAYQILSKHNLPENSSDYWEAEWTAGWVALRFLEEPKDALKHFLKMKRNVFQPVTVSRALYWEAMCYEAMGDKEKAIETYKMGADYPIFFYGQLSIHKHRNLDPVNSSKDIILPKSPQISSRDILKISESKPAQIAYILAISGDIDNAFKIFEWIINNSPTEGQIAVIMKIITEIGNRQLDVKISKVAAKRNVFFVKEKFQIVKEVMNDEYAPLVHAIIKQESGFSPIAISKVGALGFMQLMPGTAKLLTKELGIAYDQRKLTQDITYNIRLGSFYIKKLIDEFEGSEMLAIASYNAGPNATKRWINQFYDPRKEKDQDRIVDWIELITYAETRNYVQRIIENMIVYKYLMSRVNYDDVK